MLRKVLTASALTLVLLAGLSACGKNDHNSNNNQTTTVISQSSTAGDSGDGFDSQPADAPRINVQAVQQLLAQVQENNPNDWLNDFRQQINQIYTGGDVISIDAHPDANNNLMIIGYVSHSGQQGYQAGVDDQIFTIEQTGPANNNQTPYQMTYSTYGGTMGQYNGFYQNPFLMMWFINSMSAHSWNGYYTSPVQIVSIRNYRTTYRATPAYVQQRQATQQYISHTYHGAPVSVRPSASAPVSVRPGSTAPSAPSTFTPPRAAGPSSAFNRPSSSAPSAPSAPSTFTPPRASAPSTSFNRPSSSSSGGLFGSHSYSSGGGSSFHSSSGGFHHR